MILADKRIGYTQTLSVLGARNMRHAAIVLAATAALSFGISEVALAADMPVKAPVYTKAPPPVVFTWSGCYIGGQVGYAWQRDRLHETVTATGATSSYSPVDAATPDGFKGGGYVGCNWQWSGPFVVGIEADAEYANLKGSADYINTGTPPDYYDSKTHWQGSVRGRIGYAFDHVLLYATGGLAFARVEHSYGDGTAGILFNSTNTLDGWTVGAGMDYAFSAHWIGRIEYRYADFGSVTNQVTVYDEKHTITENAIRVGLAYKF